MKKTRTQHVVQKNMIVKHRHDFFFFSEYHQTNVTEGSVLSVRMTETVPVIGTVLIKTYHWYSTTARLRNLTEHSVSEMG